MTTKFGAAHDRNPSAVIEHPNRRLAGVLSGLGKELESRARRDAGGTESDRRHPRQRGRAAGVCWSEGARASTDSAAGDDVLGDYRRKRDFRLTPEPAGNARPRRRDGEPIFVVHKHLARSKHYDFRLDVEGGLKSRAVPKGPSTDPREKWLAITVEDHPPRVSTAPAR
jgi:hypothetical protein